RLLSRPCLPSPPYSHSIFFFHRSHPHPHLHSFPTRRSSDLHVLHHVHHEPRVLGIHHGLAADRGLPQDVALPVFHARHPRGAGRDRKSTRLNSSYVAISYAVFCLKKKNRLSLRPLSIRVRPV